MRQMKKTKPSRTLPLLSPLSLIDPVTKRRAAHATPATARSSCYRDGKGGGGSTLSIRPPAENIQPQAKMFQTKRESSEFFKRKDQEKKNENERGKKMSIRDIGGNEGEISQSAVDFSFLWLHFLQNMLMRANPSPSVRAGRLGECTRLTSFKLITIFTRNMKCNRRQPKVPSLSASDKIIDQEFRSMIEAPWLPPTIHHRHNNNNKEKKMIWSKGKPCKPQGGIGCDDEVVTSHGNDYHPNWPTRSSSLASAGRDGFPREPCHTDTWENTKVFFFGWWRVILERKMR